MPAEVTLTAEQLAPFGFKGPLTIDRDRLLDLISGVQTLLRNHEGLPPQWSSWKVPVSSTPEGVVTNIEMLRDQIPAFVALVEKVTNEEV